MSSSGLIYAVIVGAWAAYLVPMWLRRQDELNEARPTERFSTAIRLLSGRAGMERRYARDLRARSAEEGEPDADGPERVVTFFLVVVASDVGGYVAGVLFGKHPMAPTISPKKSWEGFAGSTLACIGAGIASVVWLLDGDWWAGAIVGAVAVLTATVGDLGESMIKRDLGIKDMSNLLPGHGGVMDRLDSLLATAPVVWLLLHLLV